MGKRLEDLNLGDSGPPQDDDLARARRAADIFVRLCSTMEDEEMYQFAYGTIVDMRITVEQSGRVTGGQQEALENIRQGALRHEHAREGWERHERRTGRRYDGFDGRNK
jgi:hypothetical protein